ncbi:glycosyltransferase family 2 protein [Bombella sp. TMW 2.2559]|uniref:Glycosyltransferase family 2 protein n=2 Tax=Bombella dulcis TaxID=2967339 RepID=A0ABT3WFA3_9PROT|nr:glycosyltransferase family 2 protein [Bombella dulcis]
MGWLAWHLSLGMEHITIIDAGVCDGGRQIAQSLSPNWPVSWCPVELPNELSAEARRLELTRCAIDQLHQVTQKITPTTDIVDNQKPSIENWILILDADEYLKPDHNLSDLVRNATTDTTAIAIHWRIHGTAGHLATPPGHIIPNHLWHAPPTYADHQFVRLLTRLDAIPEPLTLNNAFTLDQPIDQIIRLDGSLYEYVSTPILWEGGCIQHYICAQAHDGELPPFMHAYYDRNEELAPVPHRQLETMRPLANQIRESALKTGLARLLHLAKNHYAQSQCSADQWNIDQALANHVQHDTFHYERIPPSFRNTLLLNEHFSAEYEPEYVVLLRSAEGRLLKDDPPSHQEPLIGLWQKKVPSILSLCLQDMSPFTLGDVPCPFGISSLRISFDSQEKIIYLPQETGYNHTPLEIVPANMPFPFLFTPLPPVDEPNGLSIKGLFTWLLGHPYLHPVDLRRTLLLLSPSSVQHLRNLVPILEEFFPLHSAADFLPR